MERFLAAARQREHVEAVASPPRGSSPSPLSGSSAEPRLASAGRAVLALRDIATLGAEKDGLDELLPPATALISALFGYSAAMYVAVDGSRRPLLGTLVPDRRLTRDAAHGRQVLLRG